MAHIGEKFRFQPRGFHRHVAGLGQFLFGLLELSDVLRHAERADDDALLVPERHFGGQSPGESAVVPGFLLHTADNGLPGEDDELFVLESRPGMLGREKIEVRFADRFFGIFEAEFARQFLTHSGEAGLYVFEVDVVGDVVEQGAQQVAFVGQRLLHFPALRHVPEHSLNPEDVAQRIIKRRLDDLHVNLPAVGCPVFLDRLERHPRGHHQAIVALVFFGQFPGKKIKVGASDDLVQGPAQFGAEFCISEGEPARLVFAENILGERFHQGMVQDLRIPHRVFGPFAFGNVLHRPFIIEQAALGVADDPGVFGYPDHTPVLAIDLRLESGDDSILLDQPDEFLAPARLDVNLMLDIADRRDQFFRGIVAINSGQHWIG